MTPTDPSRISRRGLLALSGAGLAAMTLPERLFAQGRKLLVIAAGQDISNFDPHVATGYSASFFMRNIYDSLVRVRHAPPVIEPGLAQSWTISDDGLVYTFNLNPGAVFHDGSPLNAAAVKYSFDRLTRIGRGNVVDDRGRHRPRQRRGGGRHDGADHASEALRADDAGAALDLRREPRDRRGQPRQRRRAELPRDDPRRVRPVRADAVRGRQPLRLRPGSRTTGSRAAATSRT
jgi:hypothetical protein